MPPSLLLSRVNLVHSRLLSSADSDDVNGNVLVIFGDALLVLLAVPDFSMPFNVICLVCTAIAMCFGPVHSLTTKL